MIQKIIHSIAAHRHPWRQMKFDELAEIYTSMTMRSLAFSLIGIFVPLFLYLEGVSVEGVVFFYVLFFFLRSIITFPVGHIIGKIGPKHSIALSTVIFIVFLMMLISYSTMKWPLIALALVFTIANGMFYLALHVDFSKIQHNNHGGKELGWLTIFERLGSAAGPFVGGLIASFIAPEATIALAILVLIGSLIPLFMTNEPVKVNQKINFSKFKHKKYMRNNFALSMFNVAMVANGVFWPLYIGIFVFTDNAYAKLGALVAVSMAVSMFSAHMFGKIIDSKKGGSLLRYGTVLNLVLYVSRYFVTGSGGAVAATALSEPIVLSYKMPLVKGLYDEADSNENMRIAYLTWSEFWMSIVKSLLCLAMLIPLYYFDASSVIRVSFLVVGFLSLLMLTQKYPALKE